MCADSAFVQFFWALDRANVYLASARALGLVEMPFMSPRVPLRRPMANGNSTYLGGNAGKARRGDDFMHPVARLYAVAGSSLIVSAIVYKQWSTGSIFGGMERP